MRLIDADALETAVFGEAWYDNRDEDIAYELVNNTPIIDAVPVVRCRECLNYQRDSIFKSNYCCGRIRKPDDYCSKGITEVKI